MQYTLSTVSALVAALSLVSAAPMPQNNDNSNSNSDSEVNIVRELRGFDAASTIIAQLDATTVNDRDVKGASLRTQGPWCAGFSDEEATKPVPALNGDGIFDSENAVVYTEDVDDAVPVGSWWCAATRKEVEDFVANAVDGGNKDDEKDGDKDDNKDDDKDDNKDDDKGDNNNGDADETVRVQIELEAGTTFVQKELPANVGEVDASEVRQLADGVVSVEVRGDGECAFFDARGNNLDVSGSSDDLVEIATFVCEI